MVKKVPFDVRLANDVVDEHLDWIESKFRHLVLAAIEEQLTYEPLTPTRNRKPMDPSSYGEDLWEIRFGPSNTLRAVYSVDPEKRVVEVVAVGVKQGNRIMIAGKELA